MIPKKFFTLTKKKLFNNTALKRIAITSVMEYITIHVYV